ncbi:hypothetical protein BDR26DRAFT_1013218 [Obelidium mucronatum]|nr:hypothetical protein BDR26DRAFT_1013218 [Obelidium mucronatum]
MFLFDYWTRPELPEIWQSWVNRVYVFQSLALILFCMFRRSDGGALGSGSRWVPCRDPPHSHWIFRQFRWMLVSHIVYYVCEMALTSMWSKYTIMGTHHVFGIAIIVCFLLDQNVICVFAGLPFFLHTLLWALNISSPVLLLLYNLSLLFGASFLFCTSLALDFDARPVKYGIPMCLMCISLFFNNYFLYCYTMMGSVCVTADPFPLLGFEEQPRHVVQVNGIDTNIGSFRGPLFWVLVWWSVYVGCLVAGAATVKSRWRRNPPSFAIPTRQVSVDCEVGLLQLKDE